MVSIIFALCQWSITSLKYSDNLDCELFLLRLILLLNHTDNNQQKSVYVKQSPETASVQLGDALTFQCSLLSKNKAENTDQCPGECSVYWFRAGSGGFHPGVVYIHGNRSDEGDERSCVYSLSKTIRDSSDTGTYYCAVVTRGQILFGEGTKVDTSMYLQFYSNHGYILHMY